MLNTIKKESIIILVFVFGISINASCQSPEFSIKGIILDSINHTPLVSATVYVKNPKDSTIVSFALTDDKGAFTLKDIPRVKNLLFSIFYVGYRPYSKVLHGVKKNVLDFGGIYLSMSANTLNAITIKGEVPPIAIKGDTIQFNASSFKTRPNSVLADLLKKLPGVEVDKHGNVTAMGKPVDKIMVDGKKFFGNDPKIALQSLPSAIVDKVQITDTKTTEQQITGEPSNGRNKTINVTLKKRLDHGFFGRAYAGYGTGKHYAASTLLNHFEGKRQISLLGATNNINQVGFTVNEVQSMMNPNGSTRAFGYNTGNGGFTLNGMNFGPTQAGLNTTTTAGVNYNDDYGKHVSINGSYFYGNTKLDNDTKIAQKNILPDSTFNYYSDNIVHNDNLSHQITATVDLKDSSWRIIYQPMISLSSQTGTNLNSASSTDVQGNLINQSNSLYTNNDEIKNFSNSLNIYRTFKKKGQYLLFTMNLQNQATNGNDYNRYLNLFYDVSNASDSVNQYINNQSQNNNYQGTFGYSQPVSKKIKLHIGYQIQWQYGFTDKETFDLNDATGKYTEPDSTYSNKFRSNIIIQRPSASMTYTLDSGKWHLTAGADFNFISLHHHSFTHDMSFDQYQFFVLPSFHISHRIEKAGNMGLIYYSFIQQPSISQLLPVDDNSNPLYITKGNADLKPSVYNGINLYYNHFDYKSGNSVFLGFGCTFMQNDIVNVTTYDPQLRQTNTYTNVNGDNGLNFNASISKIKKKENLHWQIKLNSNGNLGHLHAFVNDQSYSSRNYSINISPSLTYGYKELFEFTPSYTLNYQYSRYNIKALNSSQNILQQAGLSGTLFWPGHITWASDLTYTYNSNVTPGFRKGFISWNGSVGIDLFKKRQATLQLSVYDLLDQNVSVQRSITVTYTKDTQTIILHRYFMLKLIYNLQKLGKKEKKKTPRPMFLL